MKGLEHSKKLHKDDIKGQSRDQNGPIMEPVTLDQKPEGFIVESKSILRSDSFRSPKSLKAGIVADDMLDWLEPDQVERAHVISHAVLNVMRPPEKTEMSGTNDQYRDVIERLRKKDPANTKQSNDGGWKNIQGRCPFAGFDALPQRTAKNTRYQYRAALIQYSLQAIEETHALWMLGLLKDQKDKDVLNELGRRDPSIKEKSPSPLSPRDINELAKAIRFINQNPPFLGTFAELEKKMEAGRTRAKLERARALERGLDVPEKEKRKTKKKVHDRLMLTEQRSRRKHWRDQFWDHVLELKDTPKRVEINQDKRLTIAVLSLTGCRPNEYVKGVTAHILPATPKDPEGRLLFKVEGSKVTEFDTSTYIDLYDLSPAEQSIMDARASDKSTVAMNTKGQDYRYLEIGIQTEPARWLKEYVIANSKGAMDIERDLSKEEFGKVINYVGQIQHTALLQPIQAVGIDPTDKQTERHIVANISKMVSRIGKRIFKTRENISPHTFRHAFASDLKKWYSEKKSEHYSVSSAALGHQASSTVRLYGSAGKGSKSKGSHFRATIIPKSVRKTNSKGFARLSANTSSRKL